MNLRRYALVAMATAVVSLGLISPASAGQSSPWQPVPDSDDYTVDACQTTITVSEQVNKVKSRTTTLRDGTVRTDYKGTYIVKVTTPDRRKVTLDNSGEYSEFDYPNGDIYFDIAAPGLIVYVDDVERRAFRKAGLPPVFYFTKGTLELYVGNGYENVLKQPRQVSSVCDLLHR